MAPMTLPWYPAGSLRFKKSESDSASVELKRLIGLRILVGIQKYLKTLLYVDLDRCFFLHLHLHLDLHWQSTLDMMH